MVLGSWPQHVTVHANSERTHPLSEQRPLPSGFSRDTTAAEVLQGADLTGKLAVVTGGYAGLGLVTARTLRDAGAHIVVPARDMAKATAAVGSLERFEIHPMDLADPASIDTFAQTFLATGRTIDLMIANAGIMATPFSRDQRGFERQFATNHLGHFQLIGKLWPAIAASGKARVVVLSSGGHQISDIDFTDIDFENRPYSAFVAYGQAKTANALFAFELDRRAKAAGIRAFSVHPGSILTELQREVAPADFVSMGLRDAQGNIPPERLKYLKSPEQGAATTVWCAVSPQLEGLGGLYCEDCDVAMLVTDGRRGQGGVYPWAVDGDRAQRLWTISEERTGTYFLDKAADED